MLLAGGWTVGGKPRKKRLHLSRKETVTYSKEKKKRKKERNLLGKEKKSISCYWKCSNSG